METKINIEHILFLDIETIPEERSYSDLSEYKQSLFAEKTKYQRKEEISPSDFYERAGIWAEFGRIICISVGYFHNYQANRSFRLKSFYGTNEKEVLYDFKNLLEQYFGDKHHLLCAHNGKEFDFPYLARRMIINKIPIPEKLNLFGKKPWEVAHLDTLEMWKFGDYKHYTSLNLLTNILGIESPKEDIDGSQVSRVFYEENDLERIAKYCENDTIAVAQVLLRLFNLELVRQDQILRIK